MSEFVGQILKELCDAAENTVWAELRGMGDDEKRAEKEFNEVWDNAVMQLTKLEADKADLIEALKELSETFALLAKDEGTCPANDYSDYCVAAELLERLS